MEEERQGERYTALPEEGCTKTYRDKEKQLWRYLPEKDTEKYGVLKLRGDVGRKKRKEENPVGQLFQPEGEGSPLKVYPYRGKLRYGEKMAGYLPCRDESGESVHLRVIKKDWKKILIPLLLLFLLAAAALAWGLRESGPKLDEAAIAYQMPGGLKNEDPSRIMLPGYGTLYMDGETGKVNAALLNPEGNPCYFTYHIILTETGEELYSTGVLEPGTAVKGFVIEKDLESGTYEIELRVETGQLEDYTKPMNSGVVKAKLEVEE